MSMRLINQAKHPTRSSHHVIEPIMFAPIALLLFGGAVVQGLTGFGYGLMTVPILMLILPPRMVVPMMMLQGTLLSFMVVYQARQHVRLKRILPLIIAGVISMPLGVYVLKNINPFTLKLALGILIVAFSAALLRGIRIKIKNETAAFIPVGIVSGILTGASALGGPPVILFLSNQQVEKQIFRSSIAAYFLIVNLCTLPTFALNGIITADVAKYAVYLLPAMVLGAVTGIKLADRVNEELFRRIALMIVAIAGMFLVYTGLKGLVG